jgi:hypothetical protein
VVVLVAFLPFVRSPKHYDGARILAAPFTWPDGCEPGSYSKSIRMSRACFVPSNSISRDWRIAHGVEIRHWSKVRPLFYRVGNDAIAPICDNWNEYCSVEIVYRDIFIADEAMPTNPSGWRTIERGHRP